MFKLLLAAALATFPVLDTPSPVPPMQYQKDSSAWLVTTTDPTGYQGSCKTPKGWIARGCTIDRRIVVMPNPCHYKNDNYARTLCHELGHVQGWVHPNAGKEYEDYVKANGLDK